jgi:hypothetical protein
MSKKTRNTDVKPPVKNQGGVSAITDIRQLNFINNCDPVYWDLAARRHHKAANAIYKNYLQIKVQWEEYAANWKAKYPNRKIPINLLPDDALDIFAAYNTRDDYCLLIGYALECLLKGILVKQNPSIIHDELKLDPVLKSHDLTMLCKRADIALSPIEHNLLVNIENIVTVWKYPVPLDVNKYPDKSRFINEVATDNKRVEIYDLSETIYERIRSVYLKTTVAQHGAGAMFVLHDVLFPSKPTQPTSNNA